MEGLGTLANSEYENAADLMGLAAMDEELMGYLNALDPVSKFRAMQKIAKKPSASRGSRAEMEKFFSELPAHIKDGLNKGKLRLADMTIYSIKPINASKTVKIFESQDIKESGLRNISNGRLPKNTALLVSGIILLQGVAATLGADDMKSTVFDTIDGIGALATGEFTLKANKKQIVDTMSNYSFRTNNFNMVTKGYYKLANPRLIADDVDVEWEIDLGTVTGIDPKMVLFGALHGTATIP